MIIGKFNEIAADMYSEFKIDIIEIRTSNLFGYSMGDIRIAFETFGFIVEMIIFTLFYFVLCAPVMLVERLFGIK